MLRMPGASRWFFCFDFVFKLLIADCVVLGCRIRCELPCFDFPVLYFVSCLLLGWNHEAKDSAERGMADMGRLSGKGGFFCVCWVVVKKKMLLCLSNMTLLLANCTAALFLKFWHAFRFGKWRCSLVGLPFTLTIFYLLFVCLSSVYHWLPCWFVFLSRGCGALLALGYAHPLRFPGEQWQVAETGCLLRPFEGPSVHCRIMATPLQGGSTHIHLDVRYLRPSTDWSAVFFFVCLWSVSSALYIPRVWTPSMPIWWHHYRHLVCQWSVTSAF